MIFPSNPGHERSESHMAAVKSNCWVKTKIKEPKWLPHGAFTSGWPRQVIRIYNNRPGISQDYQFYHVLQACVLTGGNKSYWRESAYRNESLYRCPVIYWGKRRKHGKNTGPINFKISQGVTAMEKIRGFLWSWELKIVWNEAVRILYKQNMSEVSSGTEQ